MPRKKIALLLLLLVVLCASGRYFLYPQFFSSQQPLAPAAQQALTLTQQSDTLQNAFKRMLALGYTAEDIHYNTGQSPDIIGASGILDAAIIPPADSLATPTATWALGGGQLVGKATEDTSDTAFYLSGIKESACRALNAAVWGDAIDALPVATNTSLEDWRTKKANTLQLFQGNDRPKGCIATLDKQYVYYNLVQAR
jgi:hypothetical protein